MLTIHTMSLCQSLPLKNISRGPRVTQIKRFWPLRSKRRRDLMTLDASRLHLGIIRNSLTILSYQILMRTRLSNLTLMLRQTMKKEFNHLMFQQSLFNTRPQMKLPLPLSIQLSCWKKWLLNCQTPPKSPLTWSTTNNAHTSVLLVSCRFLLERRISLLTLLL